MRYVRWALTAAFATGCVSYQPKPLDPAEELVALRRQTLDGFTVKHEKPGEGGEPANDAFDLSDGLNESEIVAVALTLNPDLKAKRLEIGEAQALLIAAGLWPNPEIGLDWRFGLGGATAQTLDADLLLDLLKAGERSVRKEIAAARLSEVRADILAAEWRAVAEARTQHAEVLAAEQAAALLEEETALRERLVDLVKRRRSVGEGTLLDVSAAELELAEARRDRRRAQADAESERRELNRLLGLPPEHALRLTDSGRSLVFTLFDDLPDDELEKRFLAGRFELRAKEAAYRKAEEELRLAVFRQYPHLKAGPSFGKEPEGGNFIGPALSLELPLFDRNQGEIAEKENLRERTRAEYVALLHRLKADAYDARDRLRRARLEADTQEKDVLPLIKRNQELFEGAFRARELSVIDWIWAQQRVLRARRECLESLVRYRKAALQLEAATGVPLSRPAPAPQQP